jgi:methanogenic corrinoid protein MtbC1
MSSGLNIAALAQRTGVAPDTLRKWEQRYAILQPTRTAGGQRRYSERDVARVEWLRARLDEGYRIGEAASLLGTVGVEPARSARDYLKGILQALDDGDTAEIGIRLDQALALLGVDDTLQSLLKPLLDEVGDRWERGELTVAEEHLVSEAVRSRLGHLLADSGGGVRGIVVLACAPGEHHELGLMMTSLALRRDGWKIVYLGADTPVGDAFTLAEKLSAGVVGLSVAMEAHGAALEKELGKASQPVGLQLVVGGAGANRGLARRLGAVHAGGKLADAVKTVRAFAV